MKITELARVPGIPESDVTPQIVERLGPNQAEAPWRCSAQSIVWFGRGGTAAARALPSELRGRYRSLGVVGGMVHYLDTPVGGYDEVFGAIAIQRGRTVSGHVPFMSVDSETSLVGGRSNWSLPKTLSAFEGRPTVGEVMTAQGRGWLVRAQARPLGPSVRVPAATCLMTQQWPDGQVRHSRMKVWGKARPVLVRVEVEGTPTLTEWLRPGRHLGVIFDSMEFTLGVPRDDGAEETK